MKGQFSQRLIKEGIITPLIIAIIVTAIFCISLPLISEQFPFTNRTVVLAEQETGEVKSIYTSAPDSSLEEVKKSSVDSIENNTVFGEVVIGSDKKELIYNAESKNAVGRFNLYDKGALIGEVGSAFVECYKSDSNGMRSLKNDDTFVVNTTYGTYRYLVVKTAVVKNRYDFVSLSSGISRSVVLFTDSSDGYGIGNEYYVVVAKMVK